MNDIKIDWDKGSGLVPAVVQNWRTGRILMLGYLSAESWDLTLKTKEVHFFSRSRNRIWLKGETSGNKLALKNWEHDCDGDSFLLLVEPSGPTCHTGDETCFDGPGYGKFDFDHLESLIDSRWTTGGPKDSYVASLREKGLQAIAQKVGEEAVETVIAAIAPSQPNEFLEESADLFFHWLVLARAKGVKFDDVLNVLDNRNKKLQPSLNSLQPFADVKQTEAGT